MAALVARGVDAGRISVRSEAPAWIFARRAPGVRWISSRIDPGVRQHGGLDLDLPGTLAAHLDFVASWNERVAEEADFLEGEAPALLVGDVPPLCFEAAARAGVPAVALANFGWDWILEAWVEAEPRWGPVVSRYRRAYGEAERLYRLPLHGDLSAFPEAVDVPFVVNRAARGRDACRASLGLAPDEERRLVLVSFGGFGSSPLAAGPSEDLSGYLFVGAGPAPAGFAGEWIELPSPSTEPHEELVLASDAVLGKPGYSTVAEVLAHGTRFLYLGREDFRESPVLERGLGRLGCARAMPRADFEAGRWRTHLDALFAQAAPGEAPACDGADVVADALIERLRR